MFGMGFTELLIIAVIAILFLGPDKLPSTMVEIAKFFQNAKNTIGDVKNTIEEEMQVKNLKEEALAYKKELLQTGDKIKSATDIKQMAAKLTTLEDESDWSDDSFFDDEKDETKDEKKAEPEKVTLAKKSKKRKSDKLKNKKIEEENQDV